ncbi:XRE family transcriptional regulator [Streptomyces sp. NPDC002088]|uniref:XRE family transcriptional regulator n=1 Tax=Streptomyces sp. NPDC002088 TaxID=3154665 RepID=UPI00331BFC9B
MTEQRTDFTDLVRQRRAELKITVRKLEELAVDPETGVQAKFGWISKLERGGNTDAPSAAILRALSVGLSVPLRILQEAAAAQYLDMESFIWSQDRTTRVLVAHIEEMTDVERQQLAEIAETFARRRAQRSEGGGGKSDD